jgi:hypothetical protein
LKNYKVVINTNDLKGVKLRYYYRVNSFFNKTITKENFDADLKKAIVNYLNN